MSSSQPKLKTITLGCKVNHYETEYVRQALVGLGYRDAQPREAADLCVVNTCTVTSEADAKCRQIIRRLARQNPDGRIVVMGCYAARERQAVESLPSVVDVISDRREIPDLLGRLGVIDLPSGIAEFAGRRRAIVKVQDGCLLKCSFCIIPQVRPEMRSRPLAEVLAEVRRLVDRGFREIVLTGIHLGHYGVDQCRGLPRGQWVRLAELVERIVLLEGDFRVRLSSIEATEVTRQLIDVMAAHPHRVCPHLHISVQSGSDAVLRRMRRRWGAQRIADRCLLVRQRLDNPGITTDVIVGFPGETEADFQATCRLAEQIGFSKMHIFRFSRRPGTPAAEMPDQVPAEVVGDRVARLEAIEAGLRERYHQSLVGRTLDVLLEDRTLENPPRRLGTSCRYAPVAVPLNIGQPGQVVSVHITGAGKDYLQSRVTDVPQNAERAGIPC